MNRPICRLAIPLILFAILPSSVPSSAGDVNFSEIAKVTASGAGSTSHFGVAAGVDGDTMVVGAWQGLTGEAYVYSRNQGGGDAWQEVKMLVASDATFNDYFGYSVAISHDHIVIGAFGSDQGNDGTGAAYVFERNAGGADNWGEVAKLVASDAAPNDGLGERVAINGDTVIVGARYVNGGSTDEGAAYVFSRNHGGADNWGEVAKLVGSGSVSHSYFGQSVAVSRDTAFVGAPNRDLVHIFERNHGGPDNWGESLQITGSTAWNHGFGLSLSVSGNTLAVGSPSSIDLGAAWIFERNYGGSDNWGEVQRLTASNGTVWDFFGLSVSLSGDRLLVGAQRNDTMGTDAGAAYIFERNAGGADNWGEVQEIHASDAADVDHFGEGVALDGCTVVVGAPDDDDHGASTGSAYVFAACGGGSGEWEERPKIFASDGAASDWFATSVSASGDTVIVGAVGDDGPGFYAGAAYILMRNEGGLDNWGEVAKLKASDGAADDRFGISVAVSGDTAVVGAITAVTAGGDSGAAYVFQRNQGGADNWGEVTKLIASDAASQDRFGEWVAIDGNIIAIGANSNDDGGNNSGSAYVFERDNGGADNWGEVVKLRASDETAYSFFGEQVTVSGDTVVVGSPQAQEGGLHLGAAYVYRRNQGGADNWGEVTKVLAADGANVDWFGGSVALLDDTLVVGAKQDDDGGDDAGSAYVFNRNQGGPDAWGQVEKLTAPVPAADDEFGERVALVEGRVTVSTPDANAYLGAAYVFERNLGGVDAWGFSTELVAADALVGEYYGDALAMNDEMVFVGTPYDSDFGNGVGSLTPFRFGCLEYDFGDAPEPDFPTLLASDGARHRLGGGVYMGSAIDVDPDGQPSADSDGDDTDAEGDDEDGVTLTSPILTGETTNVEVVASAACLLNAWIDFNKDEDWDDPGEQIFTNEALVAGTNALVFSVPLDTNPGNDVVARFRVSTSGGLTYTGEAADGEVEDHQVYIDEYDFGDAPDPTYPTLFASDGARHLLVGSLYLGSIRDGESDGLESPDALGDDNFAADDEDGVTFATALRLGLDASVSVEASTAGLLNAWIDFNADGDWDDPGEQIFTDTALTAGTNNLLVAVPIDATLGATFARFRVDSTGGLTPTGAAADGEVEDYAIAIEPSAELGVNIGDSPDPVRQGRRLTYSVAVDNNGGLDATGVVLTDTLDGNVSFVSASLPACNETGGVVTCNLDTLSAGTLTMVFIEVDTNPAFAGVISNTAVVTLNEEDPIAANNTDTETTTVVVPGPHVFSDGFETGDTTRWSSTTGG